MQLKRIGETLLKSNSLIITYLRSIVSSQCASWTDYIVCFCLFSLAGLDAFWATAARCLSTDTSCGCSEALPKLNNPNKSTSLVNRDYNEYQTNG